MLASFKTMIAFIMVLLWLSLSLQACDCCSHGLVVGILCVHAAGGATLGYIKHVISCSMMIVDGVRLQSKHLLQVL